MPRLNGKFKADVIVPPRPRVKLEFEELPPEMKAMIGVNAIEGKYSHQALSHLFGCTQNAIRRCVAVALEASK